MPITNIKYKGTTLSNISEELPVNITYGGRLLISLSYNQSTVLKCANKLIADDIYIGSKVLKVANKQTEADITVEVADLIAVPLPHVSGTYEYTGSSIPVQFDNVDSSLVEISGQTEGINAGTYTAIASLKNKRDYRWSDGTQTDKTIVWTINKKVFTVPTIVTDDFKYDGEPHTITLNGFNATYMSQSGDITKTEVGNYAVTVGLLDTVNYAWIDTTSTPKTLNWQIHQPVEKTGSVSVKPAAFVSGQYASVSGSYPTSNPINQGASSTKYCQITAKTGSNAESWLFYSFNLSAIPEDAEITSMTCNAKGYTASTSRTPTCNAQLYCGTGTAKGTASSNFTSSASSKAVTCGTWTREELDTCYIRFYAKRGTSSTSTSNNLRFYGADLTVNYKYYE